MTHELKVFSRRVTVLSNNPKLRTTYGVVECSSLNLTSVLKKTANKDILQGKTAENKNKYVFVSHTIHSMLGVS